MNRDPIPKKVKDALLDEYNHRCAICGGDRPHIHHIDEEPSHNDIQNLLPLCPNCHLRDQHNPTRKIDVPKLHLFRKFKDPAILLPQFHPIYTRQIFLDSIELGDAPVGELERKAEELIEFIKAFEMGVFYATRISEQIAPLRRCIQVRLGGGPDPDLERQHRKNSLDYRQKLMDNREAARSLLIEQLRYQSWANCV